MTPSERNITFREREFKGSRFRCLLLTSRERPEVAAFLTALVEPHSRVETSDLWAPGGFRNPDEAKLGETPGFLPETDRQALTNWWLAKCGTANTPNWDLVSACHVGERRGLILVEAKAHEGEFGNDRCGAREPNAGRIQTALGEANEAWNTLLPGFSLSAESHFQLCNRFAVAWKVARMGTPVTLVYLGFLDALEMAAPSRLLLHSDAQWQNCVLRKSADLIPPEAWNRTFDVDGTPLTVLIRSAVVTIAANGGANPLPVRKLPKMGSFP